MTRLAAIRWAYAVAWREQRGAVVSLLVLQAVDVTATAGFGLAMRAVIGAAVRGDTGGAVLDSVLAALCWVCTAVGGSARTNLILLLAETVAVRLDERFLRNVTRISRLDELESAENADRTAVLRGGADLAATYAWRLLDVAVTVLRLAVVLALLGTVAPAMTTLPAALVPVLWLQRRGQARVSRSVRASGPDTRLAEHLSTLLTEPGPGVEIKVTGAGPRLRELAGAAWYRLTRRQERARYTAAALAVLGWTVFTAVYGSALLTTVDAVTAGQAGPGDVLLVVTLAATLCVQTENAVTTLQRHVQGVHYLDAFRRLEALAASAEGPGTVPVPRRLRDGIVLRSLTFTHPGAATPVLHGIDLNLVAGSTVALVGEHGAGKTTLVKLLCRLYEPTGGGISVDGRPLDGISAQNWWARTTANFQDYARFAFLAREAVGVGDPTALDDLPRIERAVLLGDARQVVDRLPAGLETQLGATFAGVELSGGQWQRIALSRAFMRQDPLLFVLDEPAAALDPRSEHDLHQRQMRVARQLARQWGTVSLVVSHRFSTVQMADHIVVLHHGRIAEQGSHHELLARDGMYAELYRLQADGYRPDVPPARAAGTPTPQPGPSMERE
ncbi:MULTISPECIES: ABC transporter ATP-binding protein [unclassified Streptomyces]|uniref:ABC transporter ATP-binding protein n=1 Tax=unclassified Streptomyces TaxID=2593676 RepID=UPI0013195153|nr:MULTISPECIES: ABC transporter ATP-binding protein [unclassified Streptomyces]QHC31827.1 ATP-binding cassette domain-containing protein [Streptomyces sp. HF10]WKE69196.1 ABC transporter ATP-binding protein [Streptomyces sp. WP-1]